MDNDEKNVRELLKRVLSFQDFINNFETQCRDLDWATLDNMDGALLDLLDHFDPDGSVSQKLLRDGNVMKEEV